MDALVSVPPTPERISTADIREANVAAVCLLLREHGELTRAELTRASGLTRPTVMAVLRQLMADGLVIEPGQVRVHSGGGRPGSVLRFQARARVVAAVRLRGPHTEAVLADMAGTVLASSLAPRTPESLPWTSLVEALTRQIDGLRGAHPGLGPLAAVALSLPGSVDRTRGLWTPPGRSGWCEVPLGDSLAAALGVPVAVVNVVAATLIGRLAQEEAPAPSAVLVYVGSGVGSAATVNGRLIDGAAGSAGELGHCVMPGVEQRCPCGRRGCVEAVASARFLSREFRRITGRRAPERVAEMEASGAADVLDLLDTAADRLGLAASWLVNTINPAVVYFGGNVFTDDSTRFFDRFSAALHEAAHPPNGRGLAVLPVSSGATVTGGIHVASELLPDSLRPALRVVH